MKKNQSGFSAVEVILLLVIVSIIGFAGWRIHESAATNPATVDNSTVSSTNKAESDTDGIFTNGPGAEWKTYTNKKAGFSIQVPQKVLSENGSMCVKKGSSYRPATGIVPATIVADGDNFYVTESYTYQLSGAKENADSTTDYSGCDKTAATPELLRKYEQHGLESPLLSVVPFRISKAQSQAEVLAVAKEIFGDNTIKITGFKDNAGGWQDVDMSSDAELTFNFKFELRYYKTQGKLVYLALGQSGQLAKPSGDDFYSPDVVKSFKLLN